MILILTMAGHYQRFKDAGFNVPKYLLPWGAQTILSKILHEIINADDIDEIVLVCNSRDKAFMPHVRALMSQLGVDPNNLIMVNDTKGQAHTAMLGVLEIVKNPANCGKPIIFHNIDTILLNRNLKECNIFLCHV